MLDKLKSRKLWATVTGAALVSLGTELGLAESDVQLLVGLVMAYVLGQGIADRGASLHGAGSQGAPRA